MESDVKEDKAAILSAIQSSIAKIVAKMSAKDCKTFSELLTKTITQWEAEDNKSEKS